MSYESDMERAKGCGNPRGLGRGVDLSYMDQPQCSRCGWFRSKHSEEMPYDIPEECAGFSYIPELEPEAIVMDRMQAELESAWEALRHTNAGEVAG